MILIEVSKFAFRYGKTDVLHDVTFTVGPGEAVGLLGANGSGKSTLLWAIAGLLKGSGTVRTAGRPAMVFQNPEDQLFMPTLLQDLALRLVNSGIGTKEAERRALAQLEAFGLHDCAGRPATQMSLGQRKRAAIAAALISEPELLLIDEPTAELDGRSSRLLGETLASLNAAMLIASHDLAFLRRVARRAILLRNGTVAADGPTGAILGDSPLLELAGLL